MARTVAAGTISQAIIDAQNASSRVPYIRIYIDGTDYSARLLYLEHHEEAYRDRAVIGLSNRDNALDGLDLDGKAFKIAYGYVTGNAVAEPFGNGVTAEYTETAPLWVKSHQIISVQGDRTYQIYAEGSWMFLRERKTIGGITGWAASTAYILNQSIGATTPNGHIFKCTTAGTSGGTEPTWNTASAAHTNDGSVVWTEDGASSPYYNVFNATRTVYGLINLIIETALAWDLVDSPTDDGIIDTFKPVFEINSLPFENAAALLYRLIWMTKSYLRAEPIYTAGVLYPRFRVVYPQIADAADKTYYSDKAHWFTEYAEKTILLIPNSIVVLCNQDPTGDWNTTAYPLVVGTASDAAQIAKYTGVGNEVIEVFMAGSISTATGRTLAEVQADANLRAEAILVKLASETLGGRGIVPHDAQIELYDKVIFSDTRGM